LLQNTDGLLPIPAGKKVAIIGLADTDNALTHAGGSGEVVPSFIATPLSSFTAAYGTVRVFRQKSTLEDAIRSHACSLEALACV
jgi:hypothetical protein